MIAREKAVLGLLTLLLLGAGAILLFDRNSPRPASAEFQNLVGGLGLGPATDIDVCDFCFDPRVGSMCPQEVSPFPGGFFFCPLHGLSVFSLVLHDDFAGPAPTGPTSDAPPL